MIEAEGGNPFAEIMRRIRVTPDQVPLKSIRKTDEVLRRAPLSDMVQDEWRYLQFSTRRLKRLRKAIRAETNLAEKSRYVKVIEEERGIYLIVFHMFRFKVLAELGEGIWNGRTEITFRTGGVAVLTANSRAAYESKKENFKQRMFEGAISIDALCGVADTWAAIDLLK